MLNNNEIIQLFNKNKKKRTRGIAHLQVRSAKDGWGYLYDVYAGDYSLRLCSYAVFLYVSGTSLPIKTVDITPEQYERMTKTLPHRYKSRRRTH